MAVPPGAPGHLSNLLQTNTCRIYLDRRQSGMRQRALWVIGPSQAAATAGQGEKAAGQFLAAPPGRLLTAILLSNIGYIIEFSGAGRRGIFILNYSLLRTENIQCRPETGSYTNSFYNTYILYRHKKKINKKKLYYKYRNDIFCAKKSRLRRISN